MNAPAFQITQGDYQERITTTLRLVYSNERNPVKRLADAAKSSVGTAKNWLDGKATPQGLHMLRLMAAVPEFQAEVRRLTAMESDLDPAFDRDLENLVRKYQQLKGRQAASAHNSAAAESFARQFNHDQEERK